MAEIEKAKEIKPILEHFLANCSSQSFNSFDTLLNKGGE
jgi:hypothetical protein